MEKRLKKQKDFDLVFNKGTRLYSKTLTLLYFKSDSLKIGISVSKKHGKAVLRNRIKRLLRAAFNNYFEKMKDNYYIILLPKCQEEYNYFKFCRDLEFLLKKGKIIND
ncbi:MAG: ribonuclease P protein component [Clostridia bacterium]|nr:ribonuclease P protein component [Clostridia bacterium]